MFLGLQRWLRDKEGQRAANAGSSERLRCLERMARFLSSYYPMLLLLGVSSAQINAQPKDIVNMGAHENALLVPKQRLLDMLVRTQPDAGRWREEVIARYGAEEEASWRKSSRYPDIVCEGTGVLYPMSMREPTLHIRKLLEPLMNSNVFMALRRPYYHNEDAHDSSSDPCFYKTTDKCFVPSILLQGGSFGSFLIMQGNSLRSATKSVPFVDFMRAADSVTLLPEPELAPEEKAAIVECLKNVHPPMPLDAPPANHALGLRCDRLIAGIQQRVQAHIPPTPSNVPRGLPSTMRYSLRVGKVDERTCKEIAEFLLSTPPGLIRSMRIDAEWITHEVGGYRFDLEWDEQVTTKLWQQRRDEQQMR